MKLINKRHIFNPLEFKLPFQCHAFAQSPQTLVFSDKVRVYFSTRSKDEKSNKFLSHIVYVDFNHDFSRIIKISNHEIISLGETGSFDEHGIFPFHVNEEEDRVVGYSTGWSRRVSVSVETGIGYSISHDGGETFTKLGSGPVLTSSLHEPFLVGDGFVRKYGDKYYMWYIYGTKWTVFTGEKNPDRVYKIGQATSMDGVNWHRQYSRIIADKIDENECQALPSVIKIKNKYYMVFCYRQATDFRSNISRGYQLGLAVSSDLNKWTRIDNELEWAETDNQWDSEMRCYPHFCQINNKYYLLYNGNQFGKLGFGVVEVYE